MQKVNLEV
jgi:hypothetical protein